jgi:hypothetical protein
MKFNSTLLAVVVFSPLTLLAQVLLAQSAQAALLAGDLAISGDGLITKDSLTGLEWLDLTATQGASFDQVTAGFGGYTTEKGFRFANAAEVDALFASALAGKVGDFTSTPTVQNQVPASYYAAREINDLLGVTQTLGLGRSGTYYFSNGYVAPVSSTGTVSTLSIGSLLTSDQVINPTQTGVISRTRGEIQRFNFQNAAAVGANLAGSYLVRSSAPVKSTPEPSALLGSAIVLTGLLKPRSAKISG